MDTRELECFMAAMECGSINQAAKRVYVSPQGLGKVLRKLENELGVTLFDRTSKGIEPTRAALALYDSSKTLLADFDAIKSSVSSRGTTPTRTLRPVFAFGVQTFLGIETIERFESLHPNVRVEIAELPDEQIDESLRARKANFGVVAGPIDTTYYDARFLASIKHVAIVPKSHPLASRKQLSFSDLDGETVIMVSRQFKPYHNNMNRLINTDAIPERIIEVGEINNVSQFAERNAGIGISVQFEAENNPRPNTVVLPFSDRDCLWNLFVVHPNDQMLDTLEMEFADHLIARAKSLAAQG